MPIIRIEMFKRRSREQKRALARELTETFIRVAGGKPESVTIVLKDVDKEDLGGCGRVDGRQVSGLMHEHAD
jgi:4-oxalocrotonate tautomerase